MKNKSEFDYGRLLKRKRNEKKMTLEDLSKTICSSSYLSRIENDVVTVNNVYYQALYEKVDIDYNQVQKDRSSDIFTEIIFKFLQNDLMACEALLNQATSSKSYAEIELQLLVLFYNIVKRNYSEARIILKQLEDCLDELTSQETLFYLYTFALYGYRTNQMNIASKHLLVLSNVEYENEILAFGIYDLAINVFYEIGSSGLFFYYYQLIAKQKHYHFFAKSYTIHKMQYMTLTNAKGYQQLEKEFDNLKTLIDMNDWEIRELYYYIVLEIKYLNGDYHSIVEKYNDKLYSARAACIYAGALLRIATHGHYIEYVNVIKDYSCNKYELSFAKFIDYVVARLEGESSYKLHNYLKNQLLNYQSNYIDRILRYLTIYEILTIGYESSKYKDTLKIMIKHFDEIDLFLLKYKKD